MTAPWRKTQTAIGTFPPNRQIGIQNESMVQRVTADYWSANKTRIFFVFSNMYDGALVKVDLWL